MTDDTGPQARPRRLRGQPAQGRWPGGARIAISLVVNYEEGSELAIGDGDASREPSGPADWPISKRDLAGEGDFEYGSRCGYWRLLDIFDEQDVKCTFYACAVALERNRDAASEMRTRGHDVMRHGWRWEDVSLLTRDRSASTSGAPSSRSPRRPASGRSAGTAAMGRASIPASWSSRRAASCTTATPTTTTCRTGRWSAQEAPGDPVFAGHQRRQVQLRRLRLAARLREVPQGELRLALQGGRHAIPG